MKTSTGVVVMVAGLAIVAAVLQVVARAPAGAARPTDVAVVNTPLPVAQGSDWTTAISGTPGVTVATLPGSSVEVANDKGNPLPVRVTNHDDGGVLNLSGVANFNDGDTQVVVNFGAIPGGGVLVVEFVSALSQLPNGQRVHIRLFGDVQHFFAPQFTGTDATNDVLVLSQPTKFAVDSQVTATVTRIVNNAGSGHVQIAVSGHVIQ
jgi:hypothetical protein